MNQQYNILWLDDECEQDSAKHFILKAKRRGILLDGFTSFEEGFHHLERNLEKYDGILLDALFFEKKEQQKGDEDLEGFRKAVKKIDAISHKKKFPYFILSGQPRFEEDETFKDFYGEHYRKGKDEDVERLFLDIKAAAASLIQTQIKHRYHKVFEVCTPNYLGEQAGRDLLKILEILESNSTTSKANFNLLRQILEQLFRAANKKGFLHDKCIQNGIVNLRASSLFLAGLPYDRYQIHCDKTHFPKIIATMVKNIMDFGSLGSHTETEAIKEERIKHLTKHLETTNSPYLIHSLTLQLMDVLLWFKYYSDKNPYKEVNKIHWKKNGGKFSLR